MAAIAPVVPAVPVPLVAAAFDDAAGGGRAGIEARAADLVQRLTALGAEIRIAPQGTVATVEEGLSAMIAHGLITPDLTPVAAQRQIVQFYAASVQQRLSLASEHNRVTVDLANAGP